MEKLFSDFNDTTAEEWKDRLAKDLKGITFEDLTIADRNAIPIQPFYTNGLAAETQPLTQTPNWEICAKIKVTDAKEANGEAIHELNAGASGLVFMIKNDVAVAELLKEIELPYIYVHFQLVENSVGFAPKLKQYLTDNYENWLSINCSIGYDFIHDYLVHGKWPTDFESGKSRFLSFIKQTDGLRNISIAGTLFQNAGASSSYELACILAQLNEYLHITEGNGLGNDNNKINIAIATDTSFFEQIAKLRALRVLLPLVFDQYQINPEVHIHAKTSNIYRSPFDSYSNLLRDTIAGMAAVIGGCNSLYIQPFDGAIKAGNEFSKRMSRNQQLIFKEESYLDKVADTAAGSYYLETLTDQIAEQAWRLFQEIEQAGGLIAAFEKGIIKATIEAQAGQLIQEYKDGKRVLIGVNKFLNAKDEPQATLTPAAKHKGLHELNLAEEIMR